MTRMLYTPLHEQQTHPSPRGRTGERALFLPNGPQSQWLVMGSRADILCRRSPVTSSSPRLADRPASGGRACPPDCQSALGAERDAMDAWNGRIAAPHNDGGVSVRK